MEAIKDLETLPQHNKTILAGWDLPEVEDEMEAQLYWGDFVNEVRDVMSKLRCKHFFAYGLSLTWRNIAGYTEFTTTDAETLIRKLAPQNTEFTMMFHPTEDKGIIEVVLTHHDKPFGETMYLMSQAKAARDGIKDTYF